MSKKVRAFGMRGKLQPYIVSLSLMFLMIQTIYCQEGNMEKVWPSVLELTQASTQEENPLFQKVIEEVVTLEMERAGLRVISQREVCPPKGRWQGLWVCPERLLWTYLSWPGRLR